MPRLPYTCHAFAAAQASVVVEGTRYGAVTDSEENFTLQRLPTGTYQVHALLLGFDSKA